MIITREDLAFLTDAAGLYAGPTGGAASPTVRMAQSFESTPRSSRDLINYSIICNFDQVGPTPPTGMLGIYVSNASGTVSPRGIVTFFGRVDWVLKTQSVVNVGGTDPEGGEITPPFDLSIPFNCYSWVKIAYTANGGDGQFYAKLGGVEV